MTGEECREAREPVPGGDQEVFTASCGRINPEALAVAQIFQINDCEWSDRLVELLQAADMEVFRTKLIAENKRRLEEFRKLYGDMEE